VLTQRQKDNRRIGYDFNFHVPKSVSVLYATTKDDRILDAFRWCPAVEHAFHASASPAASPPASPAGIYPAQRLSMVLALDALLA